MLEKWERKTLKTAQQIADAATCALDNMSIALKALDYRSDALPNLNNILEMSHCREVNSFIKSHNK